MHCSPALRTRSHAADSGCFTGIRMIWYGHLHCKGGYPSLLARRYRPHGHSDELSHDHHRSHATPGHPRYRHRGPPAVPRNALTCADRVGYRRPDKDFDHATWSVGEP
jgi:hypothetical protein